MHARVTVIQPDPTSPLDLFGEWLPQQGVEVDVIDVEKDPIPDASDPDLDLSDA